MNQPQDSEAYKAKKRFFDSLMTIYGRKTVLEALQEKAVSIYRLHLANSNKRAEILDQIIELAKLKGADIIYHERNALSRISKNASQDQGVAADLQLPGYQTYEQFLATPPKNNYRLLALDGITNPQNLGMIIRSACAGNIDGILLPLKGAAQIDPLVIKASAGTLFRAPILRCQNLVDALKDFSRHGASLCALSSHAHHNLSGFRPEGASIYVLGNETHGVSDPVFQLCTEKIKIPMNNGVESLNVAVTAALIAFRDVM
ncbi:TrmH family RNA methyltransferase [Cellvibrio japonicus]|uniref:RNA methyltransferase, TrmH family n=1 Tax=Cellvibrio japonicus (strain Ueda107) TaxID=498211 RepID=B3PFS5_CELJU|nr:RNA methyltransferase [Cellvibrio japonicus]ACE83161.1 RNA methyltransferase, TrmH family [Cellvibrio japonicus Ueda107]QEI12298.1 RNA methyltransferase [Cellvibrio japonicus]QEI15872.1 RNA methyltransferase [Cellvibrio japonicus]QEI19450.1 RNA methyltransferase [Cellvibrio japonicus]